MAEIELTLPTVQYGNVKVKATPEELGVDVADAAAIGAMSAVYLNAFQQGFKQGAAVDVTVDVHINNPYVPTAEQVRQTMSDADVDTEAEAIALLKQQLGATEDGDYTPEPVVPDDEPEDGEEAYNAAYSAPNDGPEPAPWDKRVDAKQKPWETGAKAPANVAEIDWS